MAEQAGEIALPLAEEVLTVGRRTVETGRVRVRTLTDTHEQTVRDALVRTGVEIERIEIGREVDAVPPIRTEGDVTIVPVVEEILVVEKRLRLVEEVRIRRHRQTERVEQTVALRRMRAEVDRLPPSEPDPESTVTQGERP